MKTKEEKSFDLLIELNKKKHEKLFFLHSHSFHFPHQNDDDVGAEINKASEASGMRVGESDGEE